MNVCFIIIICKTESLLLLLLLLFPDMKSVIKKLSKTRFEVLQISKQKQILDISAT